MKESLYEILSGVIESLSDLKYIMVAVGSSMGRYEEISSENNQQYPDFFEKIEGKKMVVLIDKELENPIRLTERKDFLESVVLSNDMKYYKFQGFCAIGINENLYYTLEKEMEYDDPSEIQKLVFLCLIKNIKLIWQDYTGKDTTEFYFNMLREVYIDDPSVLLHNILFDVTEKDGGCFVDFSKVNLDIGKKGNFVQHKYMKFTEKNLEDRIHFLRHPLLWKYKNNDQYYSNLTVEILYLIYGINNRILKDLIKEMLKDLVEFSGEKSNQDIFDFYFTNIDTEHNKFCEFLKSFLPDKK